MFPYDTLALGFAAAVDAALISEETVDALLREMGIGGTSLSSWGWHKLSLEVGNCMAQPCSPELGAVGHPGRSAPEAADRFQQDTHEQGEERTVRCEDLGALNSSFTLSQGQFFLLWVQKYSPSGLGCQPEDNSKINLQKTILIFLFVPCKDSCLIMCVSPFSFTQTIPAAVWIPHYPSWTGRTNLQLPAEAQAPQSCWDFCT